MPEVVHVFVDKVVFNSRLYTAQVATRPEGHIWEAWIEFQSDDGWDVRRTPRETTQPDRDAVVYWATGLSPTYLEGAMRRATEPPVRLVREVLPPPIFSGPARAVVHEAAPTETAILDPFSVGAKGEDLLRRELGALAGWHLRNIVRAYELADPVTDVERLTEDELIEVIVAAVQPV